MERSNNTTIIFMLIFGMLSSAAQAKTTSVLLQEGLYAEEIQGDLDAAIKIYEQVISESKETQRAAAQATYRIGMCYLKKGQKDKAAEHFQNIISNFAGQKALVAKAEKQLDKIKPLAERIVEQAVMTISTCAEGDPRVTRALESLKGLDENVVVNELVKFLDSETDTVRRSTIYILWRGNLSDISAAVPVLEKLCSHKKELTRGMAALALGQAKVNSSFDTLCDMTLKDNSGYARRCGAIALGWMGRADARPILEKALEDPDPLVCNNAKAALAILPEKARPLISVFEPQALDELIKSGKVPAFKTQIYDNTGLDLDTGVSVPFMDEWPTLCDVAWDNDEGGALMIKPKSSVRFIALGGAEKWEDAISMARNSLAVLRTSTSKGMFASESKFGTVLTSEGNLAVIQIGEYDDKKGTIYGWVEKIPAEVYCFGPVKEVTLIDVDHTITKGKPCAINFATGSVMTIPRQPQMSANDAIEWVRRRGIDAVAESESGLIGVDMAIVTMPSENWDTITPMELRTLQVPPNLRSQKTIQMSYYEGQDQPIYAFRTRKDQYGTLQIIDVNKQNQDVRFRYKMLQGRVENTAIANALSVAEAFLSAAISGRESEAIKLVKPGSAVAQQVKEFQEIAEKDKVKVVSVYGDEEAALAITAEVRVGPDEKGQISIRLIKQRGNWMVEDVDLEIPASLKTEIDSFLQKHPNATKLQEDQFRYKTLQEQAKSPIDLSTPEATIKSFVKAVYVGNLEAAKACVSKDGRDYDEFMEMLATESNHPFQAMIKAMDTSIPVEITSKDITEDRCKIKWYFTLGRVYYIGDDETKWKKGMHPEFSSYLELVGDKWLIRDI